MGDREGEKSWKKTLPLSISASINGSKIFLRCSKLQSGGNVIILIGFISAENAEDVFC